MSEQHRLPPGARLIHVGPPKTGTTAIQYAFHRSRQELAEFGVVYAGSDSTPRDAAAFLTGMGASGRKRPAASAWDDLVREVREAGTSRVCISNELLSAADDEAAKRLVEDLGGPDAHVILFVRRLHALLPSQWQQRVKKRGKMIDYEEWLRLVLSDQSDDEHHRHFWRYHDLAAQLERWAKAASPERVIAAVYDEADKNALPRVFEGLLGLPAGLLPTGENPMNRSLDRAGAELLRSLDLTAKANGWAPEVYADDVKLRISRYLRNRPSVSADPIALPAWAADRVSELNEDRARLLQSTPVQVVGDPQILMTDRRPARSAPDAQSDVSISVSDAAQVAAVGIERLLTRQRQLERKLAEAKRAAPGRRTSVGARGRRWLTRARRLGR